jgi:glycosyltransferase involved in cell wall biosynthesis
MTVAISVIVPSMGQAKYLPEALASIRGQTFAGDVEVVVAAGTEAEASLARALGVVAVVDGCDRGPGDARNRAIDVATGPYILPLDADDVLEPMCLELFMSHADDNTIVSSSTKSFGIRNSVWVLPPFDKVLEMNPLSTASLFPRKMWEQVGGFDVGLGYEDWDFWVKCSKLQPQVVQLRETLLRYRVHSESAMARIDAERLDPLYRAMLRLRHPDCYAGNEPRDQETVARMSPQVYRRLIERLRAFPDNAALLAFKAMVFS